MDAPPEVRGSRAAIASERAHCPMQARPKSRPAFAFVMRLEAMAKA
jgi:hypothetical protein